MSAPTRRPAPVRALPERLTRWPAYVFAQLAEEARRDVEIALAPLGIRAKQLGALVLLDAEGPMAQNRVGERLRIDKSPMVLLMDELEAAGLVERRRDPGDRRAYALELTADGRRVLAEGAALAEEARDAFLAPLGAAERERLHRTLTRLLARD